MVETPTHASFLKRIGQVIGKILHVIGTDVKPAADRAAAIAEVLLPQFAPEIALSINLLDAIAKQAIVTEAITTGIGAAVSGPEKLTSLVNGMSAEMDAWVSSRFPGSDKLSQIEKTNLVQAIVDIINNRTTPVIS